MTLRRFLLSCCCLALLSVANAQEANSVFSFLSVPTSAHAVALGGSSVSLVEDDISLVFRNPSLMSNVSDKSLGMNFLTYMKGVNAGSAAYCQAVGERGTWGVGALFQGYGSITETLPTGEVIGSTKPLDMCLSGGYSYLLSDFWSAGAMGKFIYSHYGEFTSCALAVDLGLNYFNEDIDFSAGLAARNLGGQVKRFGDHSEQLPINLEVGVSKGLGHAPVTLSLTLIDMTAWRQNDYFSTTGKVSAGRIFTNHLTFGIDIRPVNFIYVAGGYNFRRAYEMKAAGGSHAAGLSFGAGVELKKFKFGFSYAKYHVSMPAFAFSLAYSFDK